VWLDALHVGGGLLAGAKAVLAVKIYGRYDKKVNGRSRAPSQDLQGDARSQGGCALTVATVELRGTGVRQQDDTTDSQTVCTWSINIICPHYHLSLNRTYSILLNPTLVAKTGRSLSQLGFPPG
jgi:hypothetical protein